MTATPSLSDVLSQAARSLQEQHGDVESTLQAITTAAIASVPGAAECGISYVTGRSKLQPRAATSDLPEKVDALQQQLQQGPCLDAVWHEEIVRVDDVSSDRRWPQFAEQAAALGVGSMMCFQLFVTGDQLGALDIHTRHPGAFDAEGEDIGRLFASHAAVALAGAEHEANLRAGMNNRTVIGQAQGILMERHLLTGAEPSSCWPASHSS